MLVDIFIYSNKGDTHETAKMCVGAPAHMMGVPFSQGSKEEEAFPKSPYCMFIQSSAFNKRTDRKTLVTCKEKGPLKNWDSLSF